MKHCPKCQKSFPDSAETCPDDNTKLADFDVSGLVGKTIDGKYEIQTLLGLGGMGGVFRARHTFINNEVAIKLINPKLATHEEIVERFLREARAAAAIDHPNAVKVTDFGRADGMLYLVMEYVAGYNLTQLIRKKGKLSPSTTANIMSQICAALDDAHAKKIIHRDLKPDNVMIKVDRNKKHIVKVFDFGIAKMMMDGKQDNSITRAGTIVGTVNYMSPEQCRGEGNIDLRSDIYSLGVVAFEMLTGRLPFTAPTPTGLAVKHIVEPPPSLRSIVSEIPESVDKAVLKALNKEPKDRYTSAGEFANELLHAAHSEGLYDQDTEFPPVSGISTGDYNKPPKTSSINAISNTQLNAQGNTTVTENQKPKWLYAALGIVLLVVLAGGGYVGVSKFLVKAPAPPGSQEDDKRYPGMVLIKGGWMKMGSEEGNEDERPVRDIKVDSFYMDVTPVTNTQFQKFVNETKYVTDAEKEGEEYDWQRYASSERADHPVTCISWNDAMAYAKWADKRLPTEAEWEYAARGGKIGESYPWGKEDPKNHANFGQGDLAGAALTGEVELPTKAVKAYPANGYGLFNMAGNVWQWCNDWYEKGYYFSASETNPKGPASGKVKVLRGGSWYTDAAKIRVSARNSDTPTGGRQNDYGFRCAKDK
ncbi:MAG: SUMF1/EgtB/PvdO family nonheme iron enzyme [Acidobacteria bacterium]|nr:SUMF1/EgtB/PvdO family nonheme iron enzyme [Acidobacteriota bacterium]